MNRELCSSIFRIAVQSQPDKHRSHVCLICPCALRGSIGSMPLLEKCGRPYFWSQSTVTAKFCH